MLILKTEAGPKGVQFKQVSMYHHIYVGQNKDYKIGNCCLSAEHTALRSKSTDRLAHNQDKCQSGATFLHADCCLTVADILHYHLIKYTMLSFQSCVLCNQKLFSTMQLRYINLKISNSKKDNSF
jgi:hypothetical protein